MNQQSSQGGSAKKKRRTNAPSQRAAAAVATAAIRAMQDFGPHPMLSDKKENFMPIRNPPQYSNDNNLVASNPFEDPPQRSYDIPTGPSLVPAQFTVNPTPRRGITPDQIGNMSYMGMRRMQQANQLAAINPMGPPASRFEHPSVPVVNPINNMRLNNMPLGQMGNANNVAMQGNANHGHHHHHHNPNHMMNTHMGSASMTGGGMINATTMNNSGLAMNGSTMISPMTGLINESANSANQMMRNRASPINQMIGNSNPVNSMLNIPALSPLMSPNHMNSALNIPPMTSINSTQQHYNQTNTTRGPIQRPSNMSIPGMNSTIPVTMMGPNNQMNKVHVTRSFGNVTNTNIMSANPLNMGQPMGHNVQNTMPGKLNDQEMNMGMTMLMPDLQVPMDPKGMDMLVSDDKIFPPNQPIVFNNQNPNAPPISPCGICRREVQATDQAVFCESGCNFWFHRRCAGLTDMAFDMLMAEPYAEWVCDKCVTSKDIPLVKYKS